MGACEVPGGLIGWPTRCLGYPGKETTFFSPHATKDGHLTSSAWMPMHGTWPHPAPREVRTADLYDLFTAAPPQSAMPLKRDASQIWKKFGFCPTNLTLKQREELLNGKLYSYNMGL